MRELVASLKAVADESRLRILNMLLKRRLCVCEIAEVLGLAQSTVSRHLKQLEECGLLEKSKDGLWVEYRLSASPDGSLQRRLLALVRTELAGSAAVAADETRAGVVDRKVICGQQD